MPTTRRLAELGPLHDLLLSASPADDKGDRSISVLADALGVAPQGLYRVVSNGKMTPMRALSIMEVSDGRIEANDLAPFIDQQHLAAFRALRDNHGLDLDPPAPSL